MVQELKDVLLKVERLSEREQKQIAYLIQEEVSWDETLQASAEKLSKLADEALNDFQNGKTLQTDW